MRRQPDDKELPEKTCTMLVAGGLSCASAASLSAARGAEPDLQQKCRFLLPRVSPPPRSRRPMGGMNDSTRYARGTEIKVVKNVRRWGPWSGGHTFGIGEQALRPESVGHQAPMNRPSTSFPQLHLRGSPQPPMAQGHRGGRHLGGSSSMPALHHSERATLRNQLMPHLGRVIDLFRVVDTDGDGRVRLPEFRQALGKLKLEAPISREQVEALFYECDLEGSGSIEYMELYKKLVSRKREPARRPPSVAALSHSAPALIYMSYATSAASPSTTIGGSSSRPNVGKGSVAEVDALPYAPSAYYDSPSSIRTLDLAPRVPPKAMARLDRRL